MLVSEIIQRVQSLYSKGVQSDDSRLTSRHIYNKILTVRSKLINQKLRKKQHVSDWNYQTLSCIKLIEAPLHECECLPDIGCTTYRTLEKLPKPLSNLDADSIESVTSLDGQIIFSFINWEQLKYKKYNKYTSTKSDYYIKNNYLYLTSKKSPEIITIKGLWENPIEVLEYPSFCEGSSEEESCISPLDTDFPIDYDLIDTLVEMCVNELVILFSKLQEDKINNNSDDIFSVDAKN